MSILPKQGKAPDPLVAVPREKKPRVTASANAPTLLSFVQFAGARKLGTSRGGFESECKRLGHTGRKTLAEWDELFNDYWTKPIR